MDTSNNERDILSNMLENLTDLRRDVKNLIKRMNSKRKHFVVDDSGNRVPSTESPPDTPQDPSPESPPDETENAVPAESSVEHPHPRLNRTHIFNRSKFLNIEDHDRLLQYVQSKNVIDAVSKVEPHKRVSLLRRLIYDNLNLSISMYMTQKLINTHMSVNTSPSDTTTEEEIETEI